MNGPAHFRMFARYNAWANARLYDAAAALTPEELTRECGAFFGSMLGTLNHLLVGDLVWMARLTGTGRSPDRLDALLHEDLPALRADREGEDARIIAFADGLDEEALNGEITFTRLADGARFTERRTDVLPHVFNHQTHHRGQAHCLLTHLGHTAPPLDLLFYQRASPAPSS